MYLKNSLLAFVSVMILVASSHAMAAKVCVSLPSTTLERWQYDGLYLKQTLEKAKHQVDLRFVKNSGVADQLSDIDNMLNKGCNYLVIAPVDGTNLVPVLEKAKNNEIPVISYDRLIMNSDAVNAYVTFDNLKVGRMQANYIVKKLAINDITTPSKNIEIFQGDIADRCVDQYYSGSMEVLKPYFDKKRLYCLSLQTKLDDVQTQDWDPKIAYERMKLLIKKNNYGPGPNKTQLNAVLCANDSVAKGVIEALLEAGYDKKTMPVITGQDCDRDAVVFMKTGLQSMSVYLDVRKLAENTLKIIDSFSGINPVSDYDRGNYFNGIANIPALVSEPVLVTKKRIKKVLFDSGYYSAEDVKNIKKKIKASKSN